MQHRILTRLAATAVALSLTACGGPIVTDLVPLPGKEDQVPEITKKETVVMTTTAGELVIEVYPEAAPNSAQRFIELVESGFYDVTPVSRVIDDFVAQFGINWRDDYYSWRDRTFIEDPSLFSLERGTLAFAKTRLPNSASTQVFINLKENNYLADMNFTVFGRVVEGMDVVDKFVRPPVEGNGLDQERLWRNGEAYLDSLDFKPTMIERAVVR
jgi:cyclophilin family peptidyl-prolyl cis-trans isomerase